MKTYFDLVGEAPKENVSVKVSSDWMRVTYDYVKSEPKKDSEGNVVKNYSATVKFNQDAVDDVEALDGFYIIESNLCI